MPPLLSLAAIQEQVNKSPNILATHLNKPMNYPGKKITLKYFSSVSSFPIIWSGI